MRRMLFQILQWAKSSYFAYMYEWNNCKSVSVQKLKLLDSSTDLSRHQDNKHHLPKLILHFLAEQLSEDRKEKGLLEFILSVLYLPFKQQKKRQ